MGVEDGDVNKEFGRSAAGNTFRRIEGNSVPGRGSIQFFSACRYELCVLIIVTNVLTAETPSTRRKRRDLTLKTLLDELNINSVRNDAAPMAFGEQAAHGFTAAFAVIEREVVHPHRDKAIGERRIHLAGELHGVLQGVFAIIE